MRKKYIVLSDGTKSYQMDNDQFVVATGDPVGIQWLLPKTLDALGVEIHEEVEVPTYFGAIVRRKGDEEAACRIGVGDLPWVSCYGGLWSDQTVQDYLTTGDYEVYVPKKEALA